MGDSLSPHFVSHGFDWPEVGKLVRDNFKYRTMNQSVMSPQSPQLPFVI